MRLDIFISNLKAYGKNSAAFTYLLPLYFQLLNRNVMLYLINSQEVSASDLGRLIRNFIRIISMVSALPHIIKKLRLLNYSEIRVLCLTLQFLFRATIFRGLSPRANYTDRAAAAGRRS